MKKVGHEKYRTILYWQRFFFAGYLQTSVSGKKKCCNIILLEGQESRNRELSLMLPFLFTAPLSIIYQFLCVQRAVWMLVFVSLHLFYSLCILAFTVWDCIFWIKASFCCLTYLTHFISGQGKRAERLALLHVIFTSLKESFDLPVRGVLCEVTEVGSLFKFM